MLANNRNAMMMVPGICRLCGQHKKCRIINYEYEYMSEKEVYSDMVRDCFGIKLSHLNDVLAHRMICATCVVRLRSTVAFKKQVLKCESELFLKSAEVIEIEDEKKEEITDIADNQVILDIGGDDSSVDHDDEPTETIEYCEVPEEIPKTEDKPKATKTSRPVPKKSNHSKIKKSKSIAKPEKTSHGVMLKKLLLMNMKNLMEKSKCQSASTSTGIAPRMRGLKEKRMLENTMTIVENSYVCPFNNITGTYYCFYCRSVFTEPAELREHNLTHDPKLFQRHWVKKRAIKIDIQRIDCRLCSEKIDTLEDFQTHITEVHGKRMYDVPCDFLKFKLTHPNITCLECGESFFFVDKLIDHMASHFGKFICEVCGAAFVQKMSLESHMKCHTKSKEPFPCGICGKNLTTNRSRYVHVSVVHEKKPVIDCFKCDEKFFSYAQRNKHLVDVHGDTRRFPCEECGKNFGTRRKFLDHNMRAHLMYEHECRACDKKFLTAKQMKVHMKSHDIE